MKKIFECDRWLKTKILNKIFEKILHKHFGVNVKMKVRGFAIVQNGDNYIIHLNADGEISKEDLENIFA